nr:MAG TPA: hypothetical protein [Caudoviricetes sp.]
MRTRVRIPPAPPINACNFEYYRRFYLIDWFSALCIVLDVTRMSFANLRIALKHCEKCKKCAFYALVLCSKSHLFILVCQNTELYGKSYYLKPPIYYGEGNGSFLKGHCKRHF